MRGYMYYTDLYLHLCLYAITGTIGILPKLLQKLELYQKIKITGYNTFGKYLRDHTAVHRRWVRLCATATLPHFCVPNFFPEIVSSWCHNSEIRASIAHT